MELTPDQKQFFDRASQIERLIKSDDWPALEIEARNASRAQLDLIGVGPLKPSLYGYGSKALLDFIDTVEDIPRQKDAMLKELSREAARTEPKPSTRRVGRQEPSDIQ